VAKFIYMKKIILTLSLLSFIYPAFSGIKEKTIPSASNETVVDTVPYKIDEEEIADYDSLISFPASNLYGGWDTKNTHYGKFDIETLKDSVKEIVLYNKNSCGYVQPFIGNVTSSFGPRKRRFHYGTDIDLETGDEVGTAFDGKVRIARKSKTYGNVVVIRHSNGLETYYAHLSKINVEAGQDVYAGQIIGLGGNTGHSHGSHLHFEVRYLGQPINPSDIISFTNHKLISDTLCLSKKTFEYISETKNFAGKNYGSSKKGKSKIYAVKKGDTLFSIAKRNGVTTKELCQKNGLKSSRALRLGQKLKV
jgi:hypothetical protein